MTKVEFAEYLGVDRQSLWGWLSGKHDPLLQHLLLMQEKLSELAEEDISLDALMGIPVRHG